MRRRAYTLVEVLAVTVLLGLVAGLGVPSLLRAIAGDPLARAADRLAQAYRDIRAQGYGHRLVLELDAWGFSPASREAGWNAALPEARLPDDVEASWTSGGRPMRTVEIDPRGHGPDLTVVLRRYDRDLTCTIDGLTGRWLPKPP